MRVCDFSGGPRRLDSVAAVSITPRPLQPSAGPPSNSPAFSSAFVLSISGTSLKDPNKTTIIRADIMFNFKRFYALIYSHWMKVCFRCDLSLCLNIIVYRP